MKTNGKNEYTLVLLFARDSFEESPVVSAVEIIRCLPGELDFKIAKLRLRKDRKWALKKEAYQKIAAEIIVLNRGTIVRRIKKVH